MHEGWGASSNLMVSSYLEIEKIPDLITQDMEGLTSVQDRI